MVRKPPLDSSVGERSYEVGYCKPPKHTRFKPGLSGNPRGRPRKSKNFTTIVRQVLEEKIPARAGEKTRKISKAEAVAIRLINSAAQGDPKALTAFLQMMRATGLIGEEDSSITSTETVDGALADHQAILDSYFKRRTRSAASSASSPVIAPPELLDDDAPDERERR